MAGYSLAHVKDHVLLRDLTALTARDRATTALLLAHIAEVDTRRLYAAAGYSAMYHYCIRTLGFSEGTAQAIPPMSGITDLPEKPKGRMILSMRKTTRDM